MGFSMRDYEFESIFNDFSQNYTYTYNVAQRRKIAEYVKDLDAYEFQFILEKISMESSRNPSIGMILGELRESVNRRKLDIQREKIAKLLPCNTCFKSGYIEASEKKPEMKTTIPYFYSFRCPYCEAAKILGISRQIPDWNQTFAQKMNIREIKFIPKPIREKESPKSKSEIQIEDVIFPF